MKKFIILTSLLSIGALANAEVGRVISSTPITQTVAVPQQTCSQGYVNEPVYNANGGGAVLGAIAGGLIGSAIGGRHGYYGGYYGRNNGAIALGAVSGALIGSQVNNGYVSRSVQNCYTQNSYQNNITGYEVVYEVNGGTYTTTTNYPPGRYINVGSDYTDYNVNNYNPPAYYPPQPVYTPRPIYVAPPVYYTPPPVYYRPYRHHGW